MTDQDIERWTAEWRAGAPPVADLARMAKRERRLLTAWIAFDWLVGAGLLVFRRWMWLAIGTAPVGFAAISIWVLTIVVLGFTVINWRGMLAADRGSAAEFLALCRPAKPGDGCATSALAGRILVADIIVVAGAMALEYRDEGADRLPGHVVFTASLATGSRGNRPALVGSPRAPARGAPRRHAACDATGNGEPR